MMSKIKSKLGGRNGCPFLNEMSHEPPQYVGQPSPKKQREYYDALNKINWDDVKKDIKQVLRDSKDFWPADYGSYAPFFIRMAW